MAASRQNQIPAKSNGERKPCQEQIKQFYNCISSSEIKRCIFLMILTFRAVSSIERTLTSALIPRPQIRTQSTTITWVWITLVMALASHTNLMRHKCLVDTTIRFYLRKKCSTIDLDILHASNECSDNKIGDVTPKIHNSPIVKGPTSPKRGCAAAVDSFHAFRNLQLYIRTGKVELNSMPVRIIQTLLSRIIYHQETVQQMG